MRVGPGGGTRAAIRTTAKASSSRARPRIYEQRFVDELLLIKCEDAFPGLVLSLNEDLTQTDHLLVPERRFRWPHLWKMSRERKSPQRKLRFSAGVCRSARDCCLRLCSGGDIRTACGRVV
jgi:hypothetical protein